MKESLFNQPAPELEGHFLIERRRNAHKGLKDPNPMAAFVITEAARGDFRRFTEDMNFEWAGTFDTDDPFFLQYAEEKGIAALAGRAIYEVGFGATQPLEPKVILHEQ